jgi:uncharacterized membrane protein YhaH (DUF805 family)
MGKYFSFKGEVNRKQFWLTILLGFVLNVIASMILQMVTGSLIMGMLPGFVWFYVILTTSVKRLREMGKPELLVLFACSGLVLPNPKNHERELITLLTPYS